MRNVEWCSGYCGRMQDRNGVRGSRVRRGKIPEAAVGRGKGQKCTGIPREKTILEARNASLYIVGRTWLQLGIEDWRHQ